MDTVCLKPFHRWGNKDTEIYDLGDEVNAAALANPPEIIVGVEFDVPDLTGWETFWPRPIQILQWTIGSSPGHPVMLDAIKRSIEALGRVQEWESDNRETASSLIEELLSPRTKRKDRQQVLEDLEALLITDPFDIEGGGVMPLIEATGPGVFTDAVFSYIQARYDLHWSQLHNITAPTRIGEMMILPVTGFAPFERPDWPRWKGVDSGAMSVVGDITHPQANVLHLVSTYSGPVRRFHHI